jgi:hypothetical protein
MTKKGFFERLGDPGIEHEGNIYVHRGRGEARGTVAQAVAFLDVVLRDGLVEASVVRAEARERGISEATLRRAKKRRGVTSIRDGDKWLWAFRLPQGAQRDSLGAQRGAQDAQEDTQAVQQDAQWGVEETGLGTLKRHQPCSGAYKTMPDGSLISVEEDRRRKGYTY